jgi:predicted nuclease of predicted toxin-antitoxin system
MGLPVRFYTDEHISRAVVKGLRQRGVDVLTVPEAGMLAASDEQHIERARLEHRVIVTHDEDYLRWHAQGTPHAGIAFAAHGTSIGDMIRGLMLIQQVLEAEDMEGKLEYI